MKTLTLLADAAATAAAEEKHNSISQVHNSIKLKNISLIAVNFFSNKNKSNLFQ